MEQFQQEKKMFNAIANPTSEFVRTKPIEAEDIKRVLPEVKDK